MEAPARQATRPPHALWEGIWRVSDPKITLASMASLVVGLSAAAVDGPFAWGWAALTVLGIFFLEAAKNASGEVFDWDSGADQAVGDHDRSPFSGGKRVLLDGLLTRRETWLVALAFYVLGAGAGLAIVALREPMVLGLGVAGVALAFYYHAPPLKLAYRGLGELAVGLAYGPLVASGAYLVQRGTITAEVVALAVPLGLLVTAFLWINEFPDATADASAGKRTLVVRLGKARASEAFAAMIVGAYTILLVLPVFGVPVGALLGFAGAAHGLRAARRLRDRFDDTAEIVPAQAWTLLSFCLYALGVGAGLLLDWFLAA